MNSSEGRNPEHRSNNAMLCFCVGAGLCVLAYVLGVGAVLGAAFGGGDPAAVVGGIFAAIGVTLAGVVGLILMLVGGVWMIARVVADQTGDASEKRYRDIDR
jgi:drug/metabolite transporter (DMT)-like permease